MNFIIVTQISITMDQYSDILFTQRQLGVIIEALHQDDTQDAHDLIQYIEIQIRKNKVNTKKK